MKKAHQGMLRDWEVAQALQACLEVLEQYPSVTLEDIYQKSRGESSTPPSPASFPPGERRQQMAKLLQENRAQQAMEEFEASRQRAQQPADVDPREQKRLIAELTKQANREGNEALKNIG